MHLRRRDLWLLLTAGLAWPSAWAADAPALMLAKTYRPGIDLRDFWVSEKLDGVRGRWDGQRLVSRGGQVIAAPAWFTAGWPSVPLDGELWGGRGQFESTVSTVRQQQPDDAAWHRLRFMVFDLPAHPGVFSERLQAGASLVESLNRPWVQLVPQTRGTSHAALMKRLDEVVRGGGEGLMLHRGDALYRTQRSDDLLKVKPYEDAEARVTGYEAGRGRHAGRTGALWVESAEGQRFRIGSGLSDADRESPPPIGSWITYRFRGRHESGLPRFATFVRVRADAPLQGLP